MQTEPPNANPPKRNRRWFQFSLRTLLIGVTIVAIPCAWLGRKIEQKRREREAVDAIIKLGGRVSYDYQKPSGTLAGQNAEPTGPRWLRNLLGENFFSEVVRVSFPGNGSDDALSQVEGLTKLEMLRVKGINITDAGLANLKELTRLERLTLECNSITDAGVAHLKSLSQLRWLDLVETKVTDAGVKDLQKSLPNCTISR